MEIAFIYFIKWVFSINAYTNKQLFIIDLIFTDEQNFSGNTGVHASLHQVVHSSFNLKYLLPHPTPPHHKQKKKKK